jgi:TonB family protein
VGIRAGSLLRLTLVAATLAACTHAGSPGAPGGVGTAAQRDHPYVTAVRRRIHDFWSYPCVPDAESGGCEYKEAVVAVEIGIDADGALANVRVDTSSGIPLYDEAALNAVRAAAPFDAVPDEVRRIGERVTVFVLRFHYLDRSRVTPAEKR